MLQLRDGNSAAYGSLAPAFTLGGACNNIPHLDERTGRVISVVAHGIVQDPRVEEDCMAFVMVRLPSLKLSTAH